MSVAFLVASVFTAVIGTVLAVVMFVLAIPDIHRTAAHEALCRGDREKYVRSMRRAGYEESIINGVWERHWSVNRHGEA